MSAQSQLRNPANEKGKAFTAQNLTSSKNREGLSDETMNSILMKVQTGDRNQARGFLSQTLNVNDVVAECCLRHLEEKLKAEQDYQERILRQAKALGAANITDHQQFLRDAFGVQGIVTKAILNHW